MRPRTSVLMLLTTVAASLIPARRASKIDPQQALREV
jgi:ABC-type lipoprotein release transport system permease subunit